MSDFAEAVKNIFSEHQLPITDRQIQQMDSFYLLMNEKNKVMNLTRITEPAEAALKHFYDSVCILKYLEFKNNASIIDIGTGAGFPGIPLKIMRPDLAVTLLDSSSKKIDFIESAVRELGIDVTTYPERAEILSQQAAHRDRYDYVLSRAVAPLQMLLELCIPFVKTNGCFIAYKGMDYENELHTSTQALTKLHSVKENIYFPYPDRAHALMIFKKLKNTEKLYPRKFTLIKKKPL